MSRRWALLAMALLAADGCSRDNKAIRQARMQFQIVMESKLKELDRGIAELRDVGEADAKVANDVERLEREHAELREALTQVSAASDNEWHQLKEDLEFRYRNVRDDFNVTFNRVMEQEARAAPDSQQTMHTIGASQSN